MKQEFCRWCNMPQHAGGCDREALKEVIRVLRLEAVARQKIPGENVIMLNSLVSHRTQKPRVDIQVGEIHTQMSAAAALDVALKLIQVCAGANADAFIFNFVTEKLKSEPAHGAMIIEEFRDYRDELQREFDNDQRQDPTEGQGK